MDWQSLLNAIALVFIIEGILPFFNPSGYKKMLGKMRELPDPTLRRYAVCLLGLGLILLYLVP